MSASSSSVSAVFRSIAKQCATATPASMGRHEMLAMLSELIAYNETSLTSRETHPADLVATVTKYHAAAHSSSSPKFSEASTSLKESNADSRGGGGRGPLIKSVEKHKLPLSLWAAVLPWEIQRGYSCTPEAVVCGRNGMPLLKKKDGVEGEAASVISDEDLLKDDPLAVVSSENTATRKAEDRGAARAALEADRRREGLKGSNGVLFIHREKEKPHYWSGGIQGALDVSFLSLPTDPDAAESVQLANKVSSARNGLQFGPYQMLGHSGKTGAGYGLLDDPGPYHYYLKARKEMNLCVESTSFLDPFPAVLRSMRKDLGGEGEVFGGDHFEGTQHVGMDKRFQCQPDRFVKAPITAILETRRKLIGDLMRTIGISSSHDTVMLNLLLSAPLMSVLEEKEMFYRSLVEAIESRLEALLEECHKPISKKESDDIERDRKEQRKEVRPMESWRTAANAGAPKSELLAEVPPAQPESRLGTEGSFSLSKLKAATRICKTQPGMLVTPPVDVELFAAATRLGLAHRAQQRIVPRLVNDLSRQHIDDHEDISILYDLATDPSIQLYPRELSIAVHKGHARMELMKNYSQKSSQE